MLEHQTAAQSENHSQRHRDAEGEQEDADSVEEGENVNLFAVELRKGSGKMRCRSASSPPFPADSEHSLEHDDSDRIVQDALSKDDRVELRIDVQRVEDGEDGDRVCSGECRAEE